MLLALSNACNRNPELLKEAEKELKNWETIAGLLIVRHRTMIYVHVDLLKTQRGMMQSNIFVGKSKRDVMSFSLNSIYSSRLRDFSNKKMAGADIFWLPLFFFFKSTESFLVDK